jgi:hypothetical protein
MKMTHEKAINMVSRKLEELGVATRVEEKILRELQVDLILPMLLKLEPIRSKKNLMTVERKSSCISVGGIGNLTARGGCFAAGYSRERRRLVFPGACGDLSLSTT